MISSLVSISYFGGFFFFKEKIKIVFDVRVILYFDHEYILFDRSGL